MGSSSGSTSSASCNRLVSRQESCKRSIPIDSLVAEEGVVVGAGYVQAGQEGADVVCSGVDCISFVHNDVHLKKRRKGVGADGSYLGRILIFSIQNFY